MKIFLLNRPHYFFKKLPLFEPKQYPKSEQFYQRSPKQVNYHSVKIQLYILLQYVPFIIISVRLSYILQLITISLTLSSYRISNAFPSCAYPNNYSPQHAQSTIDLVSIFFFLVIIVKVFPLLNLPGW